MSRRVVTFVAPRRVEVRDEPLAGPEPGEVRVETVLSGVSAGTELLVYRGEAPEEMAADATIPALAGSLKLPRPYGYASVGRVSERGAGVERPVEGALVFAYQPHGSAFVAPATELLEVPDGISAEAAALLPTMETAVNLLLDGEPMIGERVVVFGQGLVGLAATALLARFPLARLVTVDLHERRREVSLELGAGRALDASVPAPGAAARRALGPGDGADLAYELAGAPAALDAALAATGFAGRVVLGSWYGARRASLDLGGRFHRSRIRLLSSQVSTVDPARCGRWSKERRLAVAWSELARLDVGRLVSHRVPLERAPDLYRLLDENPGEVLGAVLTSGPEAL